MKFIILIIMLSSCSIPTITVDQIKHDHKGIAYEESETSGPCMEDPNK